MENYKWNLQEIRNNIEKLNKLLVKTKNEEKRIVIMDTITQYQTMLSEINENNINCNIDNETDISLEKYMNQYMEYLSEKDEVLINAILSTYDIIKNFEPKNNSEYVVNLNNEQLLEICNDFLKSTLPPLVYKKYEKDILNSISQIHIQNSLSNRNGSTYIDPILKQKYILINLHKEPVDLCVLPHEYFHYIFNDYQSYLYSNNPMYYSQELEGSLANQLFFEFLRPYYPNVAKQLEEDFLLYYQMRTISLMILTNYLQSIRSNNKFRKNKFDKWFNYYGFNEPLNIEDIKDYIETETADDSIVYNLSYLASTDLFYIYQNDPEMAFYLLQNIRYTKSDNNVLDVFRRNHITFMDDGFKNFKKYVKKIEKEV